ncbi:MAG TPA: hypothetical protein VFJ13_11280, partial [Paracoccaceae bacterium]|nr:hypothetical protein [Paracoccaceae bacterium]
VRLGRTGVLDAFFDAYERDCPDGAVPLADWVGTRYDSDAITAGFRPWKIGDIITDRVLHRE